MKVLAVDPGLATGIARWWPIVDPVGGALVQFESSIVQRDEVFDVLNRLVPQFDVVVFETFTVTAKTLKLSRQYDALEIIGVIKFLCWRDDKPWHGQSPNVKDFAKNPRLKQLGWYKPGEGHDNDAARHLLVYIAEHDPTLLKTLIQG